MKYKIQCRINPEGKNLPPAPADLQQWQDLERMPDFERWEEAEDWLTDNKASALEALGMEFQIVPVE